MRATDLERAARSPRLPADARPRSHQRLAVALTLVGALALTACDATSVPGLNQTSTPPTTADPEPVRTGRPPVLGISIAGSSATIEKVDGVRVCSATLQRCPDSIKLYTKGTSPTPRTDIRILGIHTPLSEPELRVDVVGTDGQLMYSEVKAFSWRDIDSEDHGIRNGSTSTIYLAETG